VKKMHRPFERVYENVAYVLDYLPTGYPHDTRPLSLREPILQLVGRDYFMLLEAVPRKTFKDFKLHERVVVGRARVKVDRITRRLTYDELTSTAKTELPYAIVEIIKETEDRFVKFLNTCSLVSMRTHALELLPGIGKKTAMKILEERRRAPFKSLEDFKKRTGISNVMDILVERIVEEIKGKTRHYFFVYRPLAQR